MFSGVLMELSVIKRINPHRWRRNKSPGYNTGSFKGKTRLGAHLWKGVGWGERRWNPSPAQGSERSLPHPAPSCSPHRALSSRGRCWGWSRAAAAAAAGCAALSAQVFSPRARHLRGRGGPLKEPAPQLSQQPSRKWEEVRQRRVASAAVEYSEAQSRVFMPENLHVHLKTSRLVLILVGWK